MVVFIGVGLMLGCRRSQKPSQLISQTSRIFETRIFWKTKKNSSALVKTTRAPHMLSEGECWRVWRHALCHVPRHLCLVLACRKGSGFTDDPSMSCRQVAESREAPELLYFYSPTVTCALEL